MIFSTRSRGKERGVTGFVEKLRDVARYPCMPRLLERRPGKLPAVQAMCGTVAAPSEPQGAGALVPRAFLPDSPCAIGYEVKWSLCNVRIWHSM